MSIDIAEWKKSVEYMESVRDLHAEEIRRWMLEYYGERCPDFEGGCCCCKAWVAFDVLFQREKK